MREPIHPIRIPVRRGFTLCIGPNPWRVSWSTPEEIREWIEAQFTKVVKVCDCPSHFGKPPGAVETIWLPFQELTPWAYENLFAFKHTMDHLLLNDGVVYLHCEAGIDRSQALASLWLSSLGAAQGGPLEEVPAFTPGRERVEELTQRGLIPARAAELFAAINQQPSSSLAKMLCEMGII